MLTDFIPLGGDKLPVAEATEVSWDEWVKLTQETERKEFEEALESQWDTTISAPLSVIIEMDATVPMPLEYDFGEKQAAVLTSDELRKLRKSMSVSQFSNLK